MLRVDIFAAFVYFLPPASRENAASVGKACLLQWGISRHDGGIIEEGNGMRYVWGLCLGALALALIGCGGGGARVQPALQGHVIQGYVYYPDVSRAATRAHIAPRLADGQCPVAGATVTLVETGMTATTNNAGFFRLAVADFGLYTLRAAHASFRDPVSISVDVQSDLTEVNSGMGVGYYILAGVADYAEIADLQGPPNDVDSMKFALPSFIGRLTVLKDAAATKHGIRDAIAGAAARMQANDFLVFYFSGHGGRDATHDFICPQDTLRASFTNDLTDTELMTWLSAMPDPAQAVVILDTCYSGAFIDGTDAKAAFRNPSADPSFRSLTRIGCTVMTASARDQYSWEAMDNVGVVRGLFSRNLTIGLSSEKTLTDANGDRAITARELYNYAAAHTIADTQTYQVQNPQFQEGGNPVIMRY